MNGQAETTNKVIRNELKKKLGQAKGPYQRALGRENSKNSSRVHCISQSTIKETLYRLTYGSDTTIPIELRETSWLRQHFDEENNDVNLRVNLNLVHEIREEA